MAQKKTSHKSKHHVSYKQKKKKAKKILKSFKNLDGTQKESSIERKIRLFLEKEGIPFRQEYGIFHQIKGTKKTLYRKYDFYVSDGKNYFFLIEAHGSYYHSEMFFEGKIPKSKLSKMQRKNLLNDKKKIKIAKEKGIPLLVIWESEIKQNFANVIDKIYNEIKRQKN